MAPPDPLEAVRARLAALITEREALLEDAASAWVRFARGRGWSRSDVECLWEGLTEDLVRRGARERGGDARGARDAVLAAMAALRSRILAGLEVEESA